MYFTLATVHIPMKVFYLITLLMSHLTRVITAKSSTIRLSNSLQFLKTGLCSSFYGWMKENHEKLKYVFFSVFFNSEKTGKTFFNPLSLALTDKESRRPCQSDSNELGEVVLA